MDGNFSLCLLKRNNEKETSEPLLSEHFFAPQAEVDNYVEMDDAKKDEGKVINFSNFDWQLSPLETT